MSATKKNSKKRPAASQGKDGSGSAATAAAAEEPAKLGDFCTAFRGRGSTPANAGASKKRQRTHSKSHGAAKKKNPVQDRPGIDIVDGVMVIRTLEVGGCQSDQEDDREEVSEESGMTSTYSSFTNRTRTERWGIEETRRFYKGLQQCGTDFTMMMTLFPGRTQKQLKNKFRKESKAQPDLVDKALNPKIAKPLDVDPYKSTLGVGLDQDKDRAAGPAAPAGNDDSPAAAAAVEAPPRKSATPAMMATRAVLPDVFDATKDDQQDLVDV